MHDEREDDQKERGGIGETGIWFFHGDGNTGTRSAKKYDRMYRMRKYSSRYLTPERKAKLEEDNCQDVIKEVENDILHQLALEYRKWILQHTNQDVLVVVARERLLRIKPSNSKEASRIMRFFDRMGIKYDNYGETEKVTMDFIPSEKHLKISRQYKNSKYRK